MSAHDTKTAGQAGQLANNLRYIDITFECGARATRIVNRLHGFEGPRFTDEDFTPDTPRRKAVREIANRLRDKQCAREGVRYQPTFYDLAKYPELAEDAERSAARKRRAA